MTLDSVPQLIVPPELSADEIATYHALDSDAAWWESQGSWCRVHGPQAAEALNGLITNDVLVLPVGEGLHAAALSPKGKIVADMLVVRIDEQSFMLTVLRTTVAAWLALAKKYINPRLARVTDESESYRTWMVYGPRSSHVIASLGGGDNTAERLSDGMVSVLEEWPTWRHAPWNLGLVSVRVVRAPLMGSRQGFLLVADADAAPTVQSRLEAAPIHKGTRNVWNVARVESGRPAMGIDMDENTIPQEANLDSLGAISFTKGCYTGQETVARVHFRGHVNRQLRGLAAAAPLPGGASVVDGAGKVVGDVRSTVRSPRFGDIAMAMLRREVAIGDTVSVMSTNGAIEAHVRSLPFTPDP